MPDQTQIEQFLSALSAQKGFSGNTLSAYRNDLTQFNDYLSQPHPPAQPALRAWSDVGRDAIVSYLLHLKERRYAPTTVARKQAAIKSFFKYLKSKGAVASNPSEDLASPHVDRALPHTISSSDIERLVEKLNAPGNSPDLLRDRAMMELLYATGLRVGEMVALNLNDIDLAGRTVTTAGRAGPRKVPISSQSAIDDVRTYMEDARPVIARTPEANATLADHTSDEAALFLNHRGQRLTRQGFWLILKRYAKLAGLGEITPHTLRHSFAAQKLKNGADMRDLQRILGHANISTTQVYARVGQDRNANRPASRRGRQRKAVS
jgi:integrase/recombinase XerD